jgi:LacI family transcriptional regulator
MLQSIACGGQYRQVSRRYVKDHSRIAAESRLTGVDPYASRTGRDASHTTHRNGASRYDAPVRPPTLRDVAEAASVHVATASRALNPDTRSLVSSSTAERVLQAAKALDYRPNPIARSLRTARTDTVGLVIPDLTNPLVPPMVRGVADVLAPAGYDAWIVNTDNDPDREIALIESLRDRQVDGLIVATARLEHPWLEQLHDEGVRIVLANRLVGAGRIPSVTADNAAGSALAVEHLAGLGHTRIAHVSGPQTLSTGLVRRRGYLQAIRDHGLPEDPDLLVTAAAWTEEDGARAVGELLDRGVEFTAIAAGHDRVALGAYDALAARGRSCPGDISVVGFNDMPFMDKMRPALTTVRVAHYEIGATAARLLLDSFADPDRPARGVLLQPTLVVRSSTAPPT